MLQEMKLQYFEYLVNKFISWYRDTNNKEPSPTMFTRLKLQKLLFLVSAVNATPTNKDLLNVFDNFHALPYGPVESDIYNAMLENRFKSISFPEKHMVIKEQRPSYDTQNILDSSIQKMIDDAIEQLQVHNKQLINYPASQLVDITHKWKSWQNAIDIANILGNSSAKMSIEDICQDLKHFA